MSSNQTVGKHLESFSSAFFNALTGAMTQACGTPWFVAAAPVAEPAAHASEPVRMSFLLEGGLQGEFLIELGGTDAALLACKCLRQPLGPFGEEQSKALLQLMTAGSVEFSAALLPDYGPCTVKVSAASEPLSGSETTFDCTAADGDANHISLRMCLKPALAEALSLRAESASRESGTGEATATGGNQTGGNQAEGNQAKPFLPQVNLDLVMDVELNVTLRFGQRQLTLREVLDLTSGSVIELDRQVEEPVELLLEGKVIARGEAVVIDGNYGLRVTEVPRPISSLTP